MKKTPHGAAKPRLQGPDTTQQDRRELEIPGDLSIQERQRVHDMCAPIRGTDAGGARTARAQADARHRQQRIHALDMPKTSIWQSMAPGSSSVLAILSIHAR